jgi:pimeloyl-ACP methyl ester carboxylesterase
MTTGLKTTIDRRTSGIRKARVAGLAALLLVLLLIAAALVEQFLEKRDAARLGASEAFAQIGQSRVRYRLRGADKPGPPVVLLNGLLASAEQWELLQNDLSQRHPVLTYDRGGSGLSEGSAAHSGIDQAQELAQLLDVLHFKRPVVIVGYSLASMEARLFADRYRDRTSSLVLLDPYFPEYEIQLGERHDIRRTYARLLVVGCVARLFGVRRLLNSVKEPLAGSVDDQRAAIQLLGFPMWWAAVREWWVAKDTQRQVMAATRPLPPLIVLSNPIGDSDPAGPILWKFVARSTHGVVRFFPRELDHGLLSADDEARRALAASIDEITQQSVTAHP